jgi:hypothetical protein
MRVARIEARPAYRSRTPAFLEDVGAGVLLWRDAPDRPGHAHDVVTVQAARDDLRTIGDDEHLDGGPVADDEAEARLRARQQRLVDLARNRDDIAAVGLGVLRDVAEVIPRSGPADWGLPPMTRSTTATTMPKVSNPPTRKISDGSLRAGAPDTPIHS